MPRKYTQKSKTRVSRKSLTRNGLKRKNGKKTVKKTKKLKRGGAPLPARYFGMTGEQNFASNPNLTTAKPLPKGYTWTGLLGGLPKC